GGGSGGRGTGGCRPAGNGDPGRHGRPGGVPPPAGGGRRSGGGGGRAGRRGSPRRSGVGAGGGPTGGDSRTDPGRPVRRGQANADRSRRSVRRRRPAPPAV